MKKNKVILVISILLAAIVVQGQQSSIYSQYMFNGLAINPAYAGHDEVLSMTFLARNQSVGLEGSPNTQTFSAHTPFKRDKIGLGLQVYHESIGVTDQTGVYASYSYRLKYKSYTLSFGLQTGTNFYNSAYTSLLVNDPGDPAFSSDVKGTTFVIGSGVFLNNEFFYAGISTPQMLSATNEITQQKPFFLYGGYVFDISNF